MGQEGLGLVAVYEARMEGGGYQVLLAFCGSGYSIQLAKHELKRVMANNHQLVVGYRVQQKSSNYTTNV